MLAQEESHECGGWRPKDPAAAVPGSRHRAKVTGQRESQLPLTAGRWDRKAERSQDDSTEGREQLWEKQGEAVASRDLQLRLLGTLQTTPGAQLLSHLLSPPPPSPPLPSPPPPPLFGVLEIKPKDLHKVGKCSLPSRALPPFPISFASVFLSCPE